MRSLLLLDIFVPFPLTQISTATRDLMAPSATPSRHQSRRLAPCYLSNQPDISSLESPKSKAIMTDHFFSSHHPSGT
jgi:hypothetical protein